MARDNQPLPPAKLSTLQEKVEYYLGKVDNQYLIADKLRPLKPGNDVLCYEFVPRNESEFSVTLYVYVGGVELWCDGGWHDTNEFLFPDADEDEVARNCVELLVMLLSGEAKLMISMSGRHAYKREVVLSKSGSEESLGVTGLIFYNYFGKRSVVIKQNKAIKV